MVKQGVEVARYFAKEHSTKFYMENPVSDLCRRPYMSSWAWRKEDGVRLVEVHYSINVLIVTLTTSRHTFGHIGL